MNIVTNGTGLTFKRQPFDNGTYVMLSSHEKEGGGYSYSLIVRDSEFHVTTDWFDTFDEAFESYLNIIETLRKEERMEEERTKDVYLVGSAWDSLRVRDQ